MNESVHKRVKQEMLTICSYLKLILKYKSSLLSQMQKWNLMLEKLDDCASDRSHRSKAQSTKRSGSARQLGSRSGSAKRLIPRSGSAKRGKSPKKKP